MRRLTGWASLALLAVIGTACASGDGGGATPSPQRELTVYSGRSEGLVGALLATFEQSSGVKLNVRYGDTAELANQIVEEGDRSPADVFFAQDAGALGALQSQGRFAAIDPSILQRVPATYRSDANLWTGTSGRVRVLAYNPELVRKAELPASVEDLTRAKWKGKVGWAPTNGSFQAFVTAFRVLEGEQAAERWLRAMKDNDAKTFESNDAIAEAIGQGEIPAGLVNHYYPYEIREEHPEAKVEDHFFSGGDVGGLVNVAGVGIVAASKRKDVAADFVRYLLSDDAQKYFVEESWEYPLVPGIDPFEGLPALASLEVPSIDLSKLEDLEATLALLQKVGLV